MMWSEDDYIVNFNGELYKLDVVPNNRNSLKVISKNGHQNIVEFVTRDGVGRWKTYNQYSGKTEDNIFYKFQKVLEIAWRHLSGEKAFEEHFFGVKHDDQ